MALNILVYIEKIGDSIRKKKEEKKEGSAKKGDKEKEDVDGNKFFL